MTIQQRIYERKASGCHLAELSQLIFAALEEQRLADIVWC